MSHESMDQVKPPEPTHAPHAPAQGPAAMDAFEQKVFKRWQNVSVVTPYSRELGLRLQSVNPKWCVLEVPYQERLVGNLATGVLHGGVITAMIDSCFGLCIFVYTRQLRRMVTMDLRIDYLKPATPGRSVFAGATCYKVTHELAFVRGSAYHDTPDDPIATSQAIFMFTGGPVVDFKDS